MKVYFVGAGPGAADLITVRGLRQIQVAKVIMYAGSLVPYSIMENARNDAKVFDTASMNLEEIIEVMLYAHKHGDDVARVHSGDPSLYGAIAEQMRKLDELKIAYEITPGVPAYAAAAAALKTELTLPNICQSIILTRTSTRSSPMPDKEKLGNLAKIGATLAIHLSINNLKNVIKDIEPHYPLQCPVVIVYRVTWPDQIIIRGTLQTIREKVKEHGITRTALILIGESLDSKNFDDSQLYNANHHHIFRPKI